MKKIFVTRKLLKENEDKLKELFDVKLNSNDKIYSAQEIIVGSKNCDGIFSSVTDPISADTISKFSNSIKIIANGAVGYGNICRYHAVSWISYFCNGFNVLVSWDSFVVTRNTFRRLKLLC